MKPFLKYQKRLYITTSYDSLTIGAVEQKPFLTLLGTKFGPSSLNYMTLTTELR